MPHTPRTPKVVRAIAERISERVAVAVQAREKSHRGHVYAAITAMTDRYDYRESSLAASELSVFSQNGEDGVIAELFHHIGVERSFFVEFGASDATQNNTAFLADVLGWSGLLIEADDALFARLRRKYQNNDRVSTVQSFVTPDNIDQLFEESRVPSDVDLVSIDVDGQDYWIWEALTCVRPRVVVIEYNSGLSAGSLLVEPKGTGGWRRTDFFGASIGAMRSLAKRKGYTLVYQEMAGVNAFFVRDDLVAPLDRFSVIERGPNYFLTGEAHPSDSTGRNYVTVAD